MPGIPLDELLMKSVMRIPPASHFPGITEASIEMNGISFQTASFRETPWMLASDITVQGTKIGQLKLCYLEERQASDEGPFQIHERHLLNAIAEKLSLAIERKQAETELQESNDRFNQLAAQRGTIVWEVDAQGLYTYISHVSEAVLGYRSDEIVGCMHFYDLHPEPGREAFKKAALAVFKRKETFNDLENCIQKKDGGLAWVTTYGSPILNSDGVLMGYRGSDTDITEKKSTIEQLIHSQKMESIGQLAGGLAHDLNNILSVVSGYTTLAQLGMDKNEKVFTYLNEITRASSRAASLTHSLLAYSRKQEMNQRNQNLNLVVETVGSFISRIIHDNITFTLSLQDDPLGVYVDTVQIEQVLLNLATNARDAMPEGGVFSIATATNCIDDQFIAIHGYGTLGRYAVITVTDSGHGMDEQTRIKVFDPFFTTKEAGKGTGLGLAMTMGIIKQHGGFIDLQSEPGKGSVFQLFLPLVDSGESAAETTEQSLQMENVSGTILVAEDDADTCSAMEELLTRVGYTVITAVDGQDAVEKYTARKDEIDLVIFDVVMPRKGGKAASDEMRAMSENVKFIFVSGYSSDVREREGGLGADVEIIVKPILPYELIKSIKALMPTVSERSP
ncbi:MAG: ATP-binding protein [Desulfuromonadaceae bacterium]